MRFLFKNLRYLASRDFACDIGAIRATCQRNECDIYRLQESIWERFGKLIDLFESLERNYTAMTNKIDALNDALASIDENVGKLADVANVIVAGSQENQNELKAILEKLQAGQTDVTPQLERAIAINDKLLSLGTALQGAAETIGASDALYDSPEEQLPETPGEG